MKKLLLLITLLIAISASPLLADDHSPSKTVLINGLIYSVNPDAGAEKDAYVYNYDSNALNGADLVIPETITIGSEVYTVRGINAYYYYNPNTAKNELKNDCEGLKGAPIASVSLPKTINYMLSSCFYNCRNLKKVVWNIVNYSKFRLTVKDDPGEEYNDQIKEVVFSDEVESIPEDLCFNLTGITHITIPQSVKKIGANAFYLCTGLSEITIPEGVEEIGKYAFRGSGVSVVNYNAKNCTTDFSFTDCAATTLNIGSNVQPLPCFYGMKNLQRVTIPQNVTSIAEELFFHCTSLKEVDFQGALTTIPLNAFSDCEQLTTINFPRNLQTIGQAAFANCQSLTEISIPNSVKTIERIAFQTCTSLKEVTVGTGVETFDEGAFNKCTALNTVHWNAVNCADFKDYVDDDNYDDDDYLFEMTSPFYPIRKQITTFTIGDGVKHIPDYLCVDMQMAELKLPEGLETIGKSAFRSCTQVQEINLPSTLKSVDDEGFYYCIAAKKLTLNSGLQSIGEDAFASLQIVPEVTIPQSIQHIGKGAFSGLKAITEITVPTSITTLSEGVFSNCTALSTCHLPQTMTAIGARAFYNCAAITDIDLPAALTTIGQAAFQGTGLREITISEIIESVGRSCFAQCKNLQTVYWNAANATSDINLIQNSPFYNIGPNITTLVFGDKVQSIAPMLFANLTSLASLNLPASLQKIGARAFEDCTGLVQLIVPNSVTEIGDRAFSGCTALKSAYLSQSLTTLGAEAFNPADKLIQVYCSAAEPPAINNNSFSNYNGYLYVLEDVLIDYDTHPIWGNFKRVKEWEPVNLQIDNPSSGSLQESGVFDVMSGRFTVSKEGKQVVFARGTLIYYPKIYYPDTLTTHPTATGDSVGGVWQIDLDQAMDYFATLNEPPLFPAAYWLFGWGTSGFNGKDPLMSIVDADITSSAYGDGDNDIAGTNYDWGVYNGISNYLNVPGLLRTMTKDEWDYLLNYRPNAAKLRGYTVSDGGFFMGYDKLRCMVLLPDDFYEQPGASDVVLGKTQDSEVFLSMYDGRLKGAVVLPYSDAENIFYPEGGVGYWTGTAMFSDMAYAIMPSNMAVPQPVQRYKKNLVRLVADVPVTIDNGIDEVAAASQQNKATKVLINGTIYILHNGKAYNLLGTEVMDVQ